MGFTKTEQYEAIGEYEPSQEVESEIKSQLCRII